MKDWIEITFSAEFLLLCVFYVTWANTSKEYGNLNVIYENFYLQFFAKFLFLALIASIAFCIFIGLGIFIALGVLKLKPAFLLNIGIPKGIPFLIILIFSMAFTAISISAAYAINDAARGVRGSGGWNIQSVYLITSNNIQFGDTIKESCNYSGCSSGPFGLIGQNDRDFILIKYKSDLDTYFKYHPGLYVVHQSENTYLVPTSSIPIP
jgi:hypothetical protein